ncbi:chaperonin 10-like protein [Tirmania nivea]|nr:chaperonin 10-like protein [Tirmania nivea]
MSTTSSNSNTAPQVEVPYRFTGYAAFSDLRLHSYVPKPFGPYDIDVKVNYCGVCGSDLHTLRSGWAPSIYPLVVGHEVTGRAVRVGSKVTSIKPGDFVGVGAQAWSCGACEACAGEENATKVGGIKAAEAGGWEGEVGFGGEGGLSGGNEQYCKEVVETYNWRYKDGSLAYGGFANYCRIHENFVYPLPGNVPEEILAPMLCGGVTMFSPLKRANVGPGSKVGIVGIGGLGHFGIMFAKTMGAEVTAISHSTRKQDDALKLGASRFISTSSSDDWEVPYQRSLDLIISTNFSTDMPLTKYLSLLKIGGTLVYCGIPEGNLPNFSWASFGTSNLSIKGSNVGSKKEVLQMLELVAAAGGEKCWSWIEIEPMAKAGEVLERLDRGDVRYRFVLQADS